MTTSEEIVEEVTKPQVEPLFCELCNQTVSPTDKDNCWACPNCEIVLRYK